MSTPTTLQTANVLRLFTLFDEQEVNDPQLERLLGRELLQDLLVANRGKAPINRFKFCQALCPDGSLLPFKIVHYGPSGKQMEVILGSAEEGLQKMKEVGISFWEEDTWSEAAIKKQWKNGPRVSGKFLVIEFPKPRTFGGSGHQTIPDSRKTLESYNLDGATILELMSFAPNLVQLFGREKTKTQVVSLGTEFPPFKDSSDSSPLFAEIRFGIKGSPEMMLTPGRSIGRFHETSPSDRFLYLVKIQD